MAAKYRVGVIASGRIAREHGRGWAECEHTEIAAIADAHPEALASYAADFDVKTTYTDYREMLERAEIDRLLAQGADQARARATVVRDRALEACGLR